MKRWLIAMILVSAVGIAGRSLASLPPFDQVDTNPDGTLSKQEAAAVKELDFSKADTNKNGTIEPAEYRVAAG